METDSFFWQLLKLLPETIFALLGLPTPNPGAYRFEAVEIKNPQYRLDGLFIPRRRSLPLYFVEVQFQRNPKFYANLFAKVTSFLHKNDPAQDFVAVAIFQDRSVEPVDCKNFHHWINSPNVRRVYLDELSIPGEASPALKLLELLRAPKHEAPAIATRLIQQAESELDCDESRVIVQLVEELVMRHFTELDREEIRQMIKLNPLSESKAWQEMQAEAKEQGRTENMQELVNHLLAKGKSVKEIANLFDIPAAEVRRLGRKR